MSAFIPMVSTTPPPIDDDDDDFGDFMDSGAADKDEFADFSTPTDYDDFSYSSQNMPPLDSVRSMDHEADTEDSSKILPPVVDESLKDDCEDQEVKDTMKNSSPIANFFSNSDDGGSNAKNKFQCNGDVAQENFSSYEPNSSACEHEQHYDNNILFNDKSDVEITEQNSDVNDHHSDQISLNGDYTFAESSDVISTCIDEFEEVPHSGKCSNIVSGDSFNTEMHSESEDLHLNDGKTSIQSSEENISDKSHSADMPPTSQINNSHDESKDDTGEDYDASFPSSPQSEPVDDNIQTDYNEHSSSVHCESDASKENQNTTTDISDDLTSPYATGLSSIVESSSNNEKPGSVNLKIDDGDLADSKQNQSFTVNSGEENEDDGFAEFGSFDMQPFAAPENKDSHETPEAEFSAFNDDIASDCGVGFADFSNVAGSAPDDSEFGAFPADNADVNDDFGDFDSGCNWAEFPSTVTSHLTMNEKVNSFVSKYGSGKHIEKFDNIIPQLDEHLISDTLSKDIGPSSTASVESMEIVWSGDLWDQLEDIDNTIALSFVWNGSHHNRHLLDALGMHTQNILFSGKKQAYYVPTYYAAALGMVDPTKWIMKPMSAAEKITAMSPTEKNFPTVEDLPAEDSHPEWKTIADDSTSGQGMIVANSWLRSDQTMNNQDDSPISFPSKAVPILSSAMDLEYFDNLPATPENTKLSGGTDLIDPELLEVTSAPTTEPPPPPKDPGSATLSKILASIKGESTSSSLSYVQNQDDSKWTEEESKLSTEARSVLQKLPDLSYMRSKALIFPMTMSRMTISEE